MGEKTKRYEGIVRYKGTFNFHKFYEMIFSSLRSLEYDPKETKFKQASGDDGFDVEINLTAEKEVDMDFKYVMNFVIKCYLMNLEATNPDNDGTTYGAVEIFWDAEAEIDYKNRFKNGLNKYVGRAYTWLKNPGSTTLRFEAQTIESKIKKFFNMKMDNI